MTEQLFTYQSWDIIDDHVAEYHNCCLKVQLGNLVAGCWVDRIVIDMHTGRMQITAIGVLEEVQLILLPKHEWERKR